MSAAFAQRGSALCRASEEQFLDLFIEWVKDSIHRTANYDSERLDRLREIAEGALLSVAAKHYSRILVNAVRCLPFPYLVRIVGGTIEATEAQDFYEIVSVATAAALRSGRQARPRRISQDWTAMEVTPDEYWQLPLTLPEDVSRLLAAASLRVNAVRSHRMAGKGMRLAPLPSPSALAQRQAAPEWHFLPDPQVERAINLYMQRREVAPGVAGTHVGELDHSLFWMDVAVPREPLTMSFPLLKQSITTHTYFFRPIPRAEWIETLSAFGGHFAAKFGIDIQSLKAICSWLPTAVMRQAAFDTLRDESPGSMILSFDLQPHDPRADSALTVLYDLYSKAILRSPRHEWISMFARACAEANCANPQQQAQIFVDVFTANPARQLGPEWPDLRPQLFYEVAEGELSLDLLNCEPFLQLCFRVATAGDGGVGNARGDLFEEQARQRIRTGLNLDPTREPVGANTHVPRRKELGDVDHCFTVGRMLVMLDMKSWQRSFAYHRGGYNAVCKRQEYLIKLLEKVERRAQALLEVLRQSGLGLDVASSFLCVPDAEYISLSYPKLWYRGTPRVLTPDEIIKLASNPSRIRGLRKDLLRSTQYRPTD